MIVKDFFESHSTNNIMEKAPLEYAPPLLVLLGRDRFGSPILSLSQILEEKAFQSSKAIDVSFVSQGSFGYRYDLKLTDEKFKDIFYKVAEDLLNYAESYESDRKKYAKCLIDRYRVWCTFWKKGSKTLDKEKKQGLYGELLYIEEQLQKGKDPELLMRSWKGPESAPQDFIESGFWAEIKTIKQSFDSIKVSSLEQLNNPAGLTQEESSKVVGRLIVFKLNLSPASPSPIKLTDLVNKIKSKLPSNSYALDLFITGLDMIGYDHEKELEDDFIAEVVSESIFNANAPDFPKFRRQDVNDAVIKMAYELSLPGLTKWKIE